MSMRKFKARLKRLRQRFKPVGKRGGVLFIGYAEGALGLGESFRQNLTAVSLTDLPFAVYPFRVGVETRLTAPFMPERYDEANAYEFNVIEVATDQVPRVLKSMDPRLIRGSYNILRTFWELPKAPEAWRQNLTNIQEIWAPNSFVADAFREIFSRKITIIQPTVDVGHGPFQGRASYGMQQGRFYFLFSFDYFSSAYRKNPLGVLQAFQQAFSADYNVGLIIKSVGPSHEYPEIRAMISKAAEVNPNIIVMDRSLSRSNMLGLVQNCDAYVSLHRSEGFGLGMAEAMSFGRTVIGTNFSGNTDFLTEETGFPVPYTMRPVEPHEYLWSVNQAWAEPDINSAASIMRQVVNQPNLTSKRAQAGKALIQKKFSPPEVGRAITQRIFELQSQRSASLHN